MGYLPVGLCGGQLEELIGSLGGNQFECLHQVFARFAVTDRLDLPIPFKLVVSEQVLFVTDYYGRAVVGTCLFGKEIQPLQGSLYEKATACEGDILIDCQSGIDHQLVAVHEAFPAIGQGDAADRPVERRVGSECETR